MTDRNEDSVGYESAIDKMLNDAEARIKEITMHRDGPGFQSTVDVVRDAFEAIKRAEDEKLNERNEWQAWRERIMTGLHRIDPDVELSDDDLKRRQAEVDTQCAKVSDADSQGLGQKGSHLARTSAYGCQGTRFRPETHVRQDGL